MENKTDYEKALFSAWNGFWDKHFRGKEEDASITISDFLRGYRSGLEAANAQPEGDQHIKTSLLRIEDIPDDFSSPTRRRIAAMAMQGLLNATSVERFSLMNTEDFVTYEQAVKLKEYGFDWSCTTYLNPKSYGKHIVIAGKEITMKDCTPSEVLCPSLSQAAKWLREVKGIKVYPIYDYIIQKWYYHCGLKVNRTKCSEASYATYESALSAGIDAALELIKEEA